MRCLTLAAGTACALLMVNSARAQDAGLMPGQVVGFSGTTSPVGQRLPAAAPAAGAPITSNPMMRLYDPTRPYDVFKGSNIDPNQVVAPLVGPDGLPVKPPGAIDVLADKLKAIFGKMPAPPERPPYAPGISRRNRERANMHLWRRD